MRNSIALAQGTNSPSPEHMLGMQRVPARANTKNNIDYLCSTSQRKSMAQRWLQVVFTLFKSMIVGRVDQFAWYVHRVEKDLTL